MNLMSGRSIQRLVAGMASLCGAVLFFTTNNLEPQRVSLNEPSVPRAVQEPEVKKHRQGLRRRLPGAIIIGVKKGGTRALLEYLRVHPRVRAAGPEPHFFDRHYSRGLAWYRSRMPRSRGDQLTIEKTPSYLVTEGVPERVRAMSPDVKLVVVLRNPVSRAVSDYAQRASTTTSFADAVLNNGRVDPARTLVRVGLYHAHLTRWLRHFPEESLHWVSGERLVSDPAAEVTALQRFLGLSVLEPDLDLNQTFPCVRVGASTRCLNRSKGRPHPRLDPDLERKLSEFYRPHNLKLYRMVGRDFGW